MKKHILSILLFVAAAFCVSAQDLSVLSKAARAAYDYLASEGYKPTVDEDTDVIFKAQGIMFYIDNYPQDETYLKVVLPEIEGIDVNNDKELFAALSACNEICRTKKLIQAFMWEDGTIEFSTSSYIGASAEVGEMVENSVDFMIRAVSAWVEAYNTALN